MVAVLRHPPPAEIGKVRLKYWAAAAAHAAAGG